MYPVHSLHVRPNQCVLLILDPQNDFHEGGSLAVKGAISQAQGVAQMIRDNTANNKLGEIFITLDSHRKKHIAHQSFWSSEPNDEKNRGSEPEVGTVITQESIHQGKWFPKDSSLQTYCLAYTRKLEAKKVFQLTIWPDHCLIGSAGHAIQKDIQQAVKEWDVHHFTKSVKYIHKGMNCLTEMYSAIEAEVPVLSDPSTTINMELLESLRCSGRLLICGQALSHAVNYTVRDIVKDWSRLPGYNLSNIHVIIDACAPVEGFEEVSQKFIEDMRLQGVTITTLAHAFDNWEAPALDSEGKWVDVEKDRACFLQDLEAADGELCAV